MEEKENLPPESTMDSESYPSEGLSGRWDESDDEGGGDLDINTKGGLVNRVAVRRSPLYLHLTLPIPCKTHLDPDASTGWTGRG